MNRTKKLYIAGKGFVWEREHKTKNKNRKFISIFLSSFVSSTHSPLLIIIQQISLYLRMIKSVEKFFVFIFFYFCFGGKTVFAVLFPNCQKTKWRIEKLFIMSVINWVISLCIVVPCFSLGFFIIVWVLQGKGRQGWGIRVFILSHTSKRNHNSFFHALAFYFSTFFSIISHISDTKNASTFFCLPTPAFHPAFIPQRGDDDDDGAGEKIMKNENGAFSSFFELIYLRRRFEFSKKWKS